MAEGYQLTPEDCRVLSSVADVLKRTKKFEIYPTNRVVDERGCFEIIVAPTEASGKKGCLGFLFPSYGASERDSRRIEFRRLLYQLYTTQRDKPEDLLTQTHEPALGGIRVAEAYGFPLNCKQLKVGYTDEDPRAKLEEQRGR